MTGSGRLSEGLERHPYGAVTVGFAVLSMALFPGVFLRGETFVERDMTLFYRPVKSLTGLLVDLSSSWPPGWNPFLASGQPWAANPEHAAFHPLTIVYAVLSFELAYVLNVLVPLLVASLSMTFYLRTLGLLAPVSVLGGLSFGLGGFFLSAANLLPIAVTLAPMPAALALAVRVLRGGASRIRDAALLAGTLGLAVLGGEPATLLVGILLIAVALADELWCSEPDPRPRLSPGGVGWLLVAAGLSVALGAACVWPALAFARKTPRAGTLDEREASVSSMPWIRPVELLYPRPLGHVDNGGDTRWYWGRSLYPVADYPYYYSLYQGLPLGLCFLLALRRPRRHVAWLVAGGFGLLLALGVHGPVWSLAREVVPLLGRLRFPEKFAMLFCLAVVVVGARELNERLRTGRLRSLILQASGLAGLSGAGSLAALALGSGESGGAFAAWLPADLAAHAGSVIARDATIGALSAGLLATSLVAVSRGFRVAMPALLLAVALDLWLGGRGLLGTRPVATEETPPAFLRPLLGRGLEQRLLFHSASRSRPDLWGRAIASPPVPALWRIPTTLDLDYDVTHLAWSGRAAAEILAAAEGSPALLGPALARRGVAAVARSRPAGPPPAPGPVSLVFLRDPRPFAFCVEQVEVVEPGGWASAMERLGEAASSAAIAELGTRLPAEVSPGQVVVTRRLADTISLAVIAEGPRPSVVAVNQTWDTGWTAALGTAPVEVVRTDLDLCAVVVPPGRHELTLTYRDPRLWQGMTVSALALASILGLLIVAVR